MLALIQGSATKADADISQLLDAAGKAVGIRDLDLVRELNPTFAAWLKLHQTEVKQP